MAPTATTATAMTMRMMFFRDMDVLSLWYEGNGPRLFGHRSSARRGPLAPFEEEGGDDGDHSDERGDDEHVVDGVDKCRLRRHSLDKRERDSASLRPSPHERAGVGQGTHCSGIRGVDGPREPVAVKGLARGEHRGEHGDPE